MKHGLFDKKVSPLQNLDFKGDSEFGGKQITFYL
jgi:hypothetical protein